MQHRYKQGAPISSQQQRNEPIGSWASLPVELQRIIIKHVVRICTQYPYDTLDSLPGILRLFGLDEYLPLLLSAIPYLSTDHYEALSALEIMEARGTINNNIRVPWSDAEYRKLRDQCSRAYYAKTLCTDYAKLLGLETVRQCSVQTLEWSGQ